MCLPKDLSGLPSLACLLFLSMKTKKRPFVSVAFCWALLGEKDRDRHRRRLAVETAVVDFESETVSANVVERWRVSQPGRVAGQYAVARSGDKAVC